MNFKKYAWVKWPVAVIIFTPIVIYMITFWHRSISDQTSDWGTFGDFIGGILNPIISLLTLIVTVYIAYYLQRADDDRAKREQKLAYSPQLTIHIDRAFIYAIRTPEGILYPVEVLFENVPFSQYQYAGRTAVKIPIINLGLGVAKNVLAEVEYDYEKIIAVLSEMTKKQPKYGIEVTYDADTGRVYFKGPGHNVGTNEVNHLKTTKIHYIMSVSNGPSVANVRLPPALISLFLTYVYHSWLYDRQDASMPKFPAFQIKTTYYDLENTKDSKSFEIKLSVDGGTAIPKSAFGIEVSEI